MKEDSQEKSGRSMGGEKSSQGGRGDPEKASPAAVERYLKGIHYPADKKQLIQQAEKNGAPSDVMSVLKRFGEKQFANTVEVAKEVGRVE